MGFCNWKTWLGWSKEKQKFQCKIIDTTQLIIAQIQLSKREKKTNRNKRQENIFNGCQVIFQCRKLKLYWVFICVYCFRVCLRNVLLNDNANKVRKIRNKKNDRRRNCIYIDIGLLLFFFSSISINDDSIKIATPLVVSIPWSCRCLLIVLLRYMFNLSRSSPCSVWCVVV